MRKEKCSENHQGGQTGCGSKSVLAALSVSTEFAFMLYTMTIPKVKLWRWNQGDLVLIDLHLAIFQAFFLEYQKERRASL